MLKLKDIKVDGFERVVRALNDTTGLDVTIAIHNTRLGPALGGIRYWNYDSIQAQYMEAQRLAEAMTLKNSVCGINRGGGKCVINNQGVTKTPELYRSLGEVIESLGGIYYAAGDVGTTTEDLKCVAEMTNYVGGIKFDSSRPTALGVFYAIEAWTEYTYSRDINDYLEVTVSGLGKVGYKLANMLFHRGVTLTIADILPETTQRFKSDHCDWVHEVTPDNAHKISCDVFSPCALGNIINNKTRSELGCAVIIGSANNQIDNIGTNSWLFHNGIDYIPDYLANAGGVIATDHEIIGTEDYNLIESDVKIIGDRVRDISDRSVHENRSMEAITQCLAWERINDV